MHQSKTGSSRNASARVRLRVAASPGVARRMPAPGGAAGRSPPGRSLPGRSVPGRWTVEVVLVRMVFSVIGSGVSEVGTGHTPHRAAT
ncbi:hypothetical protein GCM10009844_11260 [Nocardioides koreensis]|uniref:Uncharacterized protein n=1 Tax=Nocardioides koreensis TaxID=433651 RepID=A0ABP5L3B8_9ACTN